MIKIDKFFIKQKKGFGSEKKSREVVLMNSSFSAET